MEIPFVGGAYLGRSRNLNSQVCQNLYPEVDQTGGKSVLSLIGVPGLTLWYDTSTGAGIRELYSMGTKLYGIIGNTLYSLSPQGSKTSLGTIETSQGACWIKGDGTHLMVVDANGGYVWDGTTLTKITDTDLPSASSLTYQDGYFIVSTKNSMQFQISSLYEPTEWDATEFASKEAYSDNLRLVYSHNRDLWLFGSESTEIWFNSGATFPFERYQGGVITIGCKAPKSVASNDEAVFFLDNDLRVRMGVGVQTTVVSTPQIDYQISILSDWDQARGFCYIQDGHSFYQITISNKTLVYDVSTKFWHTRATGTSDARHPANCYAYFDNKHLVGHRDNGRILYFNPDEYTNNNEVMRAIRSCQSIHRERKNIFHHSLELEFEAGVGLSVNHPTIGSGVDPQAMLQWSDDGGKTWSNEVWTDIGALGKYKTRAIWRRLGVSRDRIYKVVISDPIKRVIISANLEATPGVA